MPIIARKMMSIENQFPRKNPLGANIAIIEEVNNMMQIRSVVNNARIVNAFFLFAIDSYWKWTTLLNRL